MFTAKGVGAQQNSDGTVTVAADVYDDRAGHVVQTLKVRGTNLNDVKAQLADQLRLMAAAADDAKLSTAVVGQILATA